MSSIAVDDPRLLGHPGGGLSRYFNPRTGQLYGWRLCFKGVGIPPKNLYHFFNMADFDGNEMKAKQAALSEQLRISYELGLSLNTCTILHTGDIEMQLTQGYVMILSPTSFEKAWSRIWHATVHAKTGMVYACANTVSRIPVLCHRFLLNAAPGQIVDHRNGRSLDQRLSNLRIVDSCKNAQNNVRRSSRTGIPGIRPNINLKGEFIAVRVSWNHQGKTLSKSLSLSDYPTPLACVKAAIELRYAIEEEYDIDSARRMRGDAYTEPSAEEVLARLQAPSRNPSAKRKRTADDDTLPTRALKKHRATPPTALEGEAQGTNDFSMLFPDTDDDE